MFSRRRRSWPFVFVTYALSLAGGYGAIALYPVDLNDPWDFWKHLAVFSVVGFISYVVVALTVSRFRRLDVG